jgi:glutathione S-transferase
LLHNLRADRRIFGLAMTTLYTFAISHYGERARWALDHKGIEHQVVNLLPGPHVFQVRRMAPKRQVPVLEHEGTIIQGSDLIIDFLDTQFEERRLSPEDVERAADLERAADRVGRHARRVLYATLTRDTIIPLWTQDGPSWGRAFYAVAYPLLARGLRSAYDLRPERVKKSRAALRDILDELDQAIADRAYFVGDAFSRVDICFASLLAPLARPTNHSVHWPARYPSVIEALIEQHQERPSWQHAQRMYAEHRYN